MKLVWDSVVFLVVNAARFLVLVALLGVGMLAVDAARQRWAKDPRASIGELQARLDALYARERDALAVEQRAERALVEGRRRVDDARQSAEQAIARATAAQQEPLRQQQLADSRLYGLLRDLGETSESSLAPEARQETFPRLCAQSALISRQYCEEWRDEAVRLTPSGSGDWHAQLNQALDEKCGLIAVARSTVRNWRTENLAVCVWPGNKPARAFAASFVLAVDSYQALQAARAQVQRVEGELTKAKAALLQLSDSTEELARAHDDALRARQLVSSELQAAEGALAQLRADPWLRLQEGWGWFWDHMIEPFGPWVLGSMATPYAISWLVWGVAGHARSLRPFRLSEARPGELEVTDTGLSYSAPLAGGGRSTLRVEEGVRHCEVHLAPGEELLVRAEYVASSYGGKSQWLLSWRFMAASYAAGLVAMTRFDGATTPSLSLGARGARHGHEYVAKVSLEHHPGVVVLPSSVVALQGALQLRRRWSLRWSSLLRGQLRYFYLSGTGSFYVAGTGGVKPIAVGRGAGAGAHAQLSEALVLAWDGGLGWGFARNENYLQAALLRRQDLFEAALDGHGLYLQGHSLKEVKVSGATRLLSGLWDVILKIFGI